MSSTRRDPWLDNAKMALVTLVVVAIVTWSRTRQRQLVRTVAVPYVVFQAALTLFRVYVGGERLDDVFTDPHWPMWYLPALCLRGRGRGRRLGAVAVLAGIAALALGTDRWAATEWLYYRAATTSSTSATPGPS